ncbi:TrmH family RNA methyltransferase [Butyrivibrio sp. MC2013]|uniref:TrmH family RNA methyltransferase n=1 Tax=Butyrivibrio sp. MC2013 TaxID=1280686 RepID=UPI00040E9A42|nr:RNA methyltransferase [Butyrivibrio sp. MC2013]
MITSATNDKVKKIAAYIAKPRLRRKDKVFVVEGIRMAREVPFDLLISAYLSESFIRDMSDEDRAYVESLPCGYEAVSDQVFNKMSDTTTPQGILCLVRQKEYEESVITDAADPLILILEDIQDPGNMGTIFRTAEAAGVSGIYMTRGCVDLFSPKVVRSTMGAIFRQPYRYTDNIVETIASLREKGIVSYAAHLKADKSVYDTDLTGPVAFLIGNEGNGLKKESADAAGGYLIIPMKGQAESLNAAVSAAILSFEAMRQRGI